MSALIVPTAKRNYLTGANVVLETNCLPLLCMIANWSILDTTMLRWIAYIKSLDRVLVYITKKKNSMVGMLTRAS